MATTSGFTPRKEFIKDQPTPLSSFALLTFSGASSVRLFSFALPVISTFKRLFEQRDLLLSFREDSQQSLYEFTLDGRPWANSKSVTSEQLILDIFSLLFQCGYGYLSTIDYGREPDDRLAIVFSRPTNLTSASRSGTPLPPASLQLQESSATCIDNPKSRRVPFALSFESATTMRVVSPPLHLTPAILQAVRNSWPRGVTSEKKVGENSFEFRLKGYKWLEADTFASDSLVHILSLLSALDAQCFTLLTSLSLTNRTRTKDLWVFTGPASESGIASETSSLLDIPPSSIKRGLNCPDVVSSPLSQHRRIATEPGPIAVGSLNQHHKTSSTDTFGRPPLSHQPAVLRKAPPRAQVPVSVIHEPEQSTLPSPTPSSPLRVNLPSMISTQGVNMTGVGTGGGVLPGGFPPTPSPQVKDPVPFPASPRSTRPPNLVLDAPPPPRPLARHHSSASRSGRDKHDSRALVSPPLLSAGVFRDSAFSSSTEATNQAPMSWTGPLTEDLRPKTKPRGMRSLSESGPALPGAWQRTPVDESPRERTPVHETGSRVELPAVVQPTQSLRKSEAALVGMIQSTSPIPPKTKRQDSAGGSGWVLVNVEGSSPTNGAPLSKVHSMPSHSPATEVPPTAKAIALVDTIESKSTRSASLRHLSRPGVRRLFK